MPQELLEQVATVDVVMAAYAAVIGAQATAYRNHVYRVVNLCVAQAPLASDALERVAVAAVFHDLGIWTDRTFDYLEPSVRLARGHLAGLGREAWLPEIERMIRDHHKLTASAASGYPLVETFRRADWIDVSRGLLRFGVPSGRIRQIQARWPNAGFHRYLLQLTVRRTRTHPWRPLPMVRL